MSTGTIRRLVHRIREREENPLPMLCLIGTKFETFDEVDAELIKTILEECPDLRPAFHKLCDKLASLREAV